MLITLLFWIQNSWQISLLELPSLLRSYFFWRSHTYQHCDFLLGLLQLVYLHCSIWPIWPPSANTALDPTLTFKPSIHFLPTLYCLLCTLTTASCSWLFLFTSCFLFPSLTPSGFFNEMLGISGPGALSCYTFFHLILLTLLVSRNLP